MTLSQKYTKQISDTFKIPKTCIHWEGEKASCLVHEGWINFLQHAKYMKIQPCWYDQFSDVGQLLLSQSNIKIPKSWMRVSIQVFDKEQGLVQSLVEEVLCYGEGRRTFGEDSKEAIKDYWNHLEKEALQKYENAFILPQKSYEVQWKEQCELMRMILCKLFSCVILDLESEKVNRKYHSEQTQGHPNILPAFGIFESREAFYVIQPYVLHTVQSLVCFSPAVLAKSHAKQLFLIYQLLQAIKFCHKYGLGVGNISLHHLNVDDKLWIQLIQPKANKVYRSRSNVSDSSHMSHSQTGSVLCYSRINDSVVDLFTLWNNLIEKHAHCNLPDITMKWTLGMISNFEYLLLLNYLAGRRIGDPNHHPVVPWVLDFSNPGSNYRDFSKSKYRLNKGDAQLDQTYSVTPASLPIFMKDGEALHIPHHISDVLSDITYYVYKARCTPRTVLCDHVRSNWVPHEYPASMERLYSWTPDECIPEFYTDPTIFQSIHDDLADLAIPSWAANCEEFVDRHMAILEGDYVSKHLNQWIDLTFGYKLSGQAAVSAKNVCLQLVDNHTKLLNHGAVQLFSSPHPQKLVSSDCWLASHLQLQSTASIETEISQAEKDKRKGSKLIEKGNDNTVELPEKFKPLLLLDKIESLLSFSLHNCKMLPDCDKNQLQKAKDHVDNPKQSLISGDLQAFACCIIELLVSAKTRSLGGNASLEKRFSLCRKICKENWREIPRPLHEVLRVLFRLEKDEVQLKENQYGALFTYTCHTLKKLPPPNVDMLLQSNFNIINFPSYFPSLYETLNKYHKLDMEIKKLQCYGQITGEDISFQLAELCKEKVTEFSKCLNRLSSHFGQEGIDLIVPYIKELYSDLLCSVQAVWSLFSNVAVCLGPKKTCETLLPHIVRAFDSEVTSPKHIKLYHRSFIVQLKVRLSLETFLNTFSTLLVEASAGYKDFANDGMDDKLVSDDHPLGLNVHDGFEVPSDGVVFTLGHDESDTHENVSMLSSKHEISLDEHRYEDIEVDLLLEGGEEETYQNKIDQDEDSESVASVPLENQSIGSTDVPSQDLMGRSLGRVSVHSVSRLMDTEGSTPSESSDSDVVDCKDLINGDLNQGRKSFTSSSGSVHEAVEATDTNVLQSITSIENKATSDSHKQPEYNLRDVASETIKWLSHLLGPVLTAKYLSRNLLRMLALCYTGEEQLQEVQETEKLLSSCKKTVIGDLHASQVLGCLSCIAIIYGEHVILIQYFMHVKQLVNSALQKLSARTEAGLVSCLSLIFHIIPYISDKTLLDVVEETIFGDILVPVIGMVASVNLRFPSGSQARCVLCYKAIDILYVISRRIGFEMTRQHMTDVLQKFFSSFDSVFDHLKLHSNTDSQEDLQEDKEELKGSTDETLYFMVFTKPNEFKINESCDTNWKPQHRRQESAGSKRSLSPPGAQQFSPEDSPDASGEKIAEIQQQLKETFTPEMAHLAYIPFCRLAGSIYMEQKLLNDDLIRHLCALHDQTLIQQQQQQQPAVSSSHNTELIREDSTDSTSGFGDHVSMVGNKLTLQNTWGSSGGDIRKKSDDDTMELSSLKSPDMELHQQRHLRENWLAYWEHEIGLSDAEDQFSFKQIRLMTFGGAGRLGHSSSVRSIYVLDNENSFLSASKDKTVKLWSLRSFGDGTGRTGCQWTYTSHKKSVFAVTMLDSLRYAASCDGSLHVWDPFMGACVRTYESTKSSPICVLTAMPAPSTSLLTATSESVIRLLDVRSASNVFDFKCSTNPVGTIRCAAVSGDAHYVAIGYSSGVISVLDVRTGLLLSSWKAHEGEILQMKSFNNQSFVTTSFDQSISLWTFEDPKLSAVVKGITEPVHCFDFYKQSLVSATTANRIGVHASLHTKSLFTSIRLKPDIFRGVVTTMTVLPLNKLLLLGSDSGQIRLLA